MTQHFRDSKYVEQVPDSLLFPPNLQHFCMVHKTKILKKSYGSHMEANFEQNTIILCPEIRAILQYTKIILLILGISNV